jgi:hypothetical protein
MQQRSLYALPSRESEFDRESDGHAVADRDADADGDADRYTDSDWVAVSDGDAHHHADANGNALCDAEADGNADRVARADGNARPARAFGNVVAIRRAGPNHERHDRRTAGHEFQRDDGDQQQSDRRLCRPHR